jgi:hypothetical protein
MNRDNLPSRRPEQRERVVQGMEDIDFHLPHQPWDVELLQKQAQRKDTENPRSDADRVKTISVEAKVRVIVLCKQPDLKRFARISSAVV